MRPEKWFRVIGSAGHGGSTKKNAAAAWRSALRRVPLCHCGEYVAKHDLILVTGTTKRAVEDADISRARGKCGRGEWWRA